MREARREGDGGRESEGERGRERDGERGRGRDGNREKERCLQWVGGNPDLALDDLDGKCIIGGKS